MIKVILIKLYVNLTNVLHEKGLFGGLNYILFQSEGVFLKKTVVNIKKLFKKEEGLKWEEKEIKPDSSLNQPYPLLNFPKISIIIPTKDKAFLVKQCIDSIVSDTTYKNYEIILIDNGSVEAETFRLIEEYKKKYADFFSCYRVDAPFNFSMLINEGVAKSGGEYLVLLNNDTKVKTPQWLEYMLEYAQLDFVGAVGPKLLYDNNTVQHAGIVIEKDRLPFHIYTGVSEMDARVNYNREYPALTGACLMIAKQKFNLVNGFDEKFVVEFNDIDFCLKLVEKGLKNIYVHKVELYHYESASRGKIYKSIKSYKRFLLEERMYINSWGRNSKIKNF